MVALVLAIIGLIFGGTSLILLVCLVPALILAIIVSGSYWHHKNHTYIPCHEIYYVHTELYKYQVIRNLIPMNTSSSWVIICLLYYM